MELFLEETNQIRKEFDLQEVLEVQIKNDIQIIRGADFQYVCYINKIGYSSALTPLGALILAIKDFKKNT